MATFDPAPGSFAAFDATDALLIGPHNRLTRNGIVFNDRSQLECFWVDDFTGFDAPDINVAAVDNVQEAGETPDPGFHKGRTMAMTGWVQAGSYPQLLRMGRALLDSVMDLVEMPMTISVADFGYFTQPPVTINCRLADRPQLATKIEQSDQTGLLRWNFTIALRASDPTYKGTTLKHVELEPAIIAIPGRPYDRVYDLTYSELMDVAGNVVEDTDPNTLVVENLGNWRASIILRATGAMGSVTVLNETTGQAMYFTNIAAGDFIEVNTHPSAGTVRDQNGQLQSSLLDARSDWITLRPVRPGFNGSNRLILFVESYESGSKLEVWSRDTWI